MLLKLAQMDCTNQQLSGRGVKPLPLQLQQHFYQSIILKMKLNVFILPFSGYNSSDPIRFGCQYNAPPFGPGEWMPGGGYVLSKESVKRFVTQALGDETKGNCS